MATTSWLLRAAQSSSRICGSGADDKDRGSGFGINVPVFAQQAKAYEFGQGLLVRGLWDAFDGLQEVEIALLGMNERLGGADQLLEVSTQGSSSEAVGGQHR